MVLLCAHIDADLVEKQTRYTDNNNFQDLDGKDLDGRRIRVEFTRGSGGGGGRRDFGDRDRGFGGRRVRSYIIENWHDPFLESFHTIQESRSAFYISLSSPLAPGLATAWWWRTSPRPPLGRTSRTSCARPARSTTPTLTRAAVARASLSLGRAATWSKFMDSHRKRFSILPSQGMLLTNWTVPS